VVEGAPHWHADPNALDLYDFMYLYTLAAFQVVLDEFALTSAHLVAQSQAAPGVVKLGIICSDKANNIVLIAPLGFAATIFGNTAEIRVRTLLRRAGQTFLQLSQSPFYDPRNIYVGLMMLQAIVLEPKRGASKRKYAAGLAYDMRDDYYRLMKLQEIKGKTVTLLLGGEDKVFREEEIRPLVEALDMKSLKIQVLPGVSHLSLGVRGGNKVLKAAVDIVRK
jgi:hypothetical protein